MPATIEDYNKVAGQVADFTEQAGQFSSASVNLSGQVMEAVRSDRAGRGISQMATDIGNTTGQIPTDTAGIRERTGDLVNPLQVDTLTAAQRGQNLRTLATTAAQSEYNSGTLKDILGEHANSLLSIAKQKEAEAQKAAAEAQSIMNQLNYEMEQRKQAWTEYYQAQQLGLEQQKINASGGSGPGGVDLNDPELVKYANAVANGSMKLSDIPIKYRAQVGTIISELGLKGNMSIEEQIKALPAGQQTAARAAYDVYLATENAKKTGKYDPASGKTGVSTGPLANIISQVKTNTFNKKQDDTYALDKQMKEIQRILRHENTGAAFSAAEIQDYINAVGDTGKQEAAVGAGLDFVSQGAARKLSTYGIDMGGQGPSPQDNKDLINKYLGK